MNELKQILYNCKMAQETGLKKQENNKLTLLQLLKLRLHLLYCKYCSRFLKQSSLINKALQIHQQNIEAQEQLTDIQKQQLQKEIERQQ